MWPFWPLRGWPPRARAGAVKSLRAAPLGFQPPFIPLPPHGASVALAPSTLLPRSLRSPHSLRLVVSARSQTLLGLMVWEFSRRRRSAGGGVGGRCRADPVFFHTSASSSFSSALVRWCLFAWTSPPRLFFLSLLVARSKVISLLEPYLAWISFTVELDDPNLEI